MLEDFIESNKINAKFISFTTIMSMESAVLTKKIPSSVAIKIRVFNTLKNDPVLLITRFNANVDIQKIKEILLLDDDEDLIELTSQECVNITGYKKGFIPPISIYGLKIIIDSYFEKKEYLFCRVDEKKFLKVPLASIIQTNDDVVFEKIEL
ncbi:MAG: YbaK/EbsC family protein [Candidatus ainarchaeum sp.]|nr:YbaK/EbsC family protein [Candidatus ainarchaeum sp.]